MNYSGNCRMVISMALIYICVGEKIMAFKVDCLKH